MAQSNPTALIPGIQIQRLKTVQNGSVRMIVDPISHDVYYTTTSGNIYRVTENGGSYTESLMYDTSDHGVSYVQGFIAHDSTFYVSGNNNSNTPLTTGIIVRGQLLPNGTRQWSVVMETEPFETADYFDHLLSGIATNRSGDSIAFCIGARGDHGEVQTRYGTYPDLRNIPLTTNVYMIPTHDTARIILQNDSNWLASSPYLFCRGIRNTFDMEFDNEDHLFGVENSGDYDNNEEMNWMRRGRHYGFPWQMGTTDNPQQFPSFNPTNDPLIPRFSKTWRLGFWYNDPQFPAPPSGVTFEQPIMNYGPDADKFREPGGQVQDASDLGISLGTFSAHRSPLGLVFDADSILATGLKGDAFMLSWTIGYDSSGCSTPPDTSIGTFVDPSQDLLHLDLAYDSLADNFRLNATRIIGGFSHPVDAQLDSNKLYVLENGYGGTSGLFMITMPVDALPCLAPGNDSCSGGTPLGLNFGAANCTDTVIYYQGWLSCSSPDTISICTNSPGLTEDVWISFESDGTPFRMTLNSAAALGISVYSGLFCDSLQLTRCENHVTSNDTIDISGLAAGWHKIRIYTDSSAAADTFNLSFIFNTLELENITSTPTSCIGCQDGTVSFTTQFGVRPFVAYLYPDSNWNFTGSGFSGISSGSYQLCLTDAQNCQVCDSVTVLEDPTGIPVPSPTSFIRISPNPASNVVLVQNKKPIDGEILFLFDTKGRIIKSFTSPAYPLKIDVSELPNGVYYMGTGTSSREKLLISR